MRPWKCSAQRARVDGVVADSAAKWRCKFPFSAWALMVACVAPMATALDTKLQGGSKVVPAEGQRYNGPTSPTGKPQVDGAFIILPNSNDVVAVHAVHVPNTDKYLYMERPSARRSKTRQIAGTLDLATNRWVRVNSSDGLFCSGHTVTSEGEVVVVGGHKKAAGYTDGTRSVRLYNHLTQPEVLVNATWMSVKRWYPTPTLLADGQILIMGGTQQVVGSSGGKPTYELYKPNTAPNQYPLEQHTVEPTFVKQMKKMLYPFNYLLPTGDVFSFGERQGRILNPQTDVYHRNADGSFLMGAVLPGTDFTQFPFTASAVYGALTPANNYSSVDLMVFGGAPVSAIQDIAITAGRHVRRMTISWSRTGSAEAYTYRCSPWSEEDLGIPRVMGDATLMPNGDVVLLNGAQAGVAGDAKSSGGSGGSADHPALWAQLYQPDRPLHARVTTLAASRIARVYHSVAALTTNATILVSGCDRCFKLQSDVPSYVSPLVRFEYRNEIFYPPAFFDTANKPKILSVNNNSPTLVYDTDFTLTWTSVLAGNSNGNVTVTSVSIAAPSSISHSFNTNQRVVVLRVVRVDQRAKTITVRSPPHPFVAPPQWYMIFAMNGKTMSAARWIKLVDTKKQGKVPQ